MLSQVPSESTNGSSSPASYQSSRVTGNKAAKSDRWGLNLGIREALQGQLLHLLFEPAIIPQVQHHILQTTNIAPHNHTDQGEWHNYTLTKKLVGNSSGSTLTSSSPLLEQNRQEAHASL